MYDDGEQEQRIWSIKRLGDNRYSGTAADVIGEAVGHSAGSVFSWRYTLDLPYKDSRIAVKFDDWMFLQSDGVMLNRAQVSKWGFNVGEVTLFFSKAQLISGFPSRFILLVLYSTVARADLTQVGEGTARWEVFKIYDAAFFTEVNLTVQQALAG